MRQEDKEFPATGLRVYSVLKINRMVTVTAKLMLRELGTVSGKYLLGIDESLCEPRCQPVDQTIQEHEKLIHFSRNLQNKPIPLKLSTCSAQKGRQR